MDINSINTGLSADYEDLSNECGAASESINYKYPVVELLDYYEPSSNDLEAIESNKAKIVETFKYNKINISIVKACRGPSFTIYEFIPAAGVKISKIRSLQDDLALSLATETKISGPIPGKGTMEITVTNKDPDLVSIRSILASEEYLNCNYDLPVSLGKTMRNEVFIFDLTRLPHLLIAGTTGQGKSICLNAILLSLLYKKHPTEVKFVLIDFSNLELGLFQKIEDHFLAKLPTETSAIIDSIASAIVTLNGLNLELDKRYDLFRSANTPNIAEYNKKILRSDTDPVEQRNHLPFIVVVINEFSEFEVEKSEIDLLIFRLCQMGRIAGIHLIVSTQRPSSNIITGAIKVNFTTRLAFRVTSNSESRIVLDENGAESLNGNGDMLLSNGNEIIRLQGAYVGTDEVQRVTDFISYQKADKGIFFLPEQTIKTNGLDLNQVDPLFEEAAKLIVKYQQGSISLLQRKLKLGYNRAGQIINELEIAGIVGLFEGSKAREVKFSDERSLQEYLQTSKKSSSSPILEKQLINQSLINTEERIPQLLRTASTSQSCVQELQNKKKSFWARLFN